MQSAFPSTSTPLVAQASEADHATRSFQSADVILRDNTITHDLYTAETSVNLDPQSEMWRGVESSIKRLPSDFKCKAIYVSTLNSHDSPLLTTLVLV